MKTRILIFLLASAVGAANVLAQTPVFSDHFADQDLPGWSGQKDSVNQQIVLSGDFGAFDPSDFVSTHLATQHLIPVSGPLPDQQTLEMRVDWVAPHQNDAMAGIHALWYAFPAHAYSFIVDEDEVVLAKSWNNVTSFAIFFYERRSLAGENLTLVLALKRDGSDLQITTRVLDKDNGNAVLFERMVTDTPASDPVLPDGSFRDWRSEADPAGAGWPIAQAPTEVNLTLQWVGSEPASAKVAFDNVEVWQYQSPELAVQRAVILAWPVASTGFLLECASGANGPWETVPDAWSRTTADQVQVSVPASTASMFYRLRFNP
ncbi:MAG: hypothetical protein AB9869_33915 [Verrucomicrobiia bacterium]